MNAELISENSSPDTAVSEARAAAAPLAPPAGGWAFFSPIPRAVYGLREAGRLQPRDVDVLGLLLDYKNRGRTTVEPPQATLAARLRCGVDTIQRSLKRLAAAALILKTRLRDLGGRLGRCVYDLAPTLALMPAHAARLRHGQWGTPEPAAAKRGQDPPATMPHGCGITERDSENVAQADNSPPKPAAPPDTAKRPAHVVQMIREGVHDHRALMLHRQFGEERCRAALKALEAARNIRNRGGWLTRYLCQGWGTVRVEAPHLPPGVTYKAIQAEMHRCGPQLVLAELERRYATAQDVGAPPERLREMREALDRLCAHAAAREVHP